MCVHMRGCLCTHEKAVSGAVGAAQIRLDVPENVVRAMRELLAQLQSDLGESNPMSLEELKVGGGVVWCSVAHKGAALRSVTHVDQLIMCDVMYRCISRWPIRTGLRSCVPLQSSKCWYGVVLRGVVWCSSAV